MLPTINNAIFAIRPEDAQRELRNRTTLRRKSAQRLLVSGLQSKNAVKDIAELPGMEESLLELTTQDLKMEEEAGEDFVLRDGRDVEMQRQEIVNLKSIINLLIKYSNEKGN